MCTACLTVSDRSTAGGGSRDGFILVGGTHNKISPKSRRGIWLARGHTWRWSSGAVAAPAKGSTFSSTSGTGERSTILARNDQQLSVPRQSQWRVELPVLLNGRHPGVPCHSDIRLPLDAGLAS